MGLIFRSILEIDGDNFAARAEALFDSWIQQKLRRADVTCRSGTVERDGIVYEFTVTEDANDSVRAWRGQSFEQRSDEQVRMSFSAVQGNGRTWAWTDVERWTAETWAPSWMPYAPNIIYDILTRFEARVGTTQLHARYEIARGDDGAGLAQSLLDPARTVPVVVVSPTREERNSAASFVTVRARTAELHRRLAGVARVVALGSGAVTSLSKALTDELGEGWDVHSGAVRTYLPGLGSERDGRWRHRIIPARLARRDDQTASRLASLPIITAACQLAPPEPWQQEARLLAAFRRGATDNNEIDQLDELVRAAEAERDAARTDALEAQGRAQDAESSVAQVMGQLDDFTKRIDYLEAKLREVDAAAVYAQPQEDDAFEPDWCEEVASHARATLTHVVVPESVDEAAAELDVHASNSAWARTAWRAFRALEAYALAKSSGSAENWDFKRFCEHSGNSAVIPAGWVATHEAESTENDRRFRRLRTLPIDRKVDPDGRTYMPAHIRVRQGGVPSPRIHFFDDCDGSTGKIHVGWFGDHLDSGAKS